jgi:hemolysin-activating ACP:hemolysin acyltransferase
VKENEILGIVGLLIMMKAQMSVCFDNNYLLQLIKIIRIGSFKIVRSEADVPIGFFLWSDISNNTLIRAKRNNDSSLVYPTMDEGRILYIHDVLAYPGWSAKVLNDLSEFASKRRVVAYSRKKRINIKKRKGAIFYSSSI